MVVRMEVRSNKCPQVIRRFPVEVDRIVRAQLLQSEEDVKVNIAKYDVIDTGTMLNSTYSKPTGEAEGMVHSPAEYSLYQDRGTRFIAGRPFFSDMVTVAEKEFPERFRELERRLG